MAVSKSDLKFYLTGAEALVAQTNASQSIGGYPSSTLVNPSTLLSGALPFKITNVFTNTAIPQSYALLVGNELLKVISTNGLKTVVERSSLDTLPRYHKAGGIAYSVNKDFFNNSLSVDGKQYRCIAVKNTGSGTFANLKFYLKYASRNANSIIRIGIEVPSTDILTGTSTGGSSISLVDKTLKGVFTTKYDNCVLVVTSGNNVNIGQNIASFDTATGTFTFIKAFPYAIPAGVTYRVENSPSQRVVSGTTAPAVTNFTGFTTPIYFENAVSINYGSRTNAADLLPNETIYLWFERSLVNNKLAFDDNRIILTASYTT
jgi:hypothetical protein